MTLVFIVTLFYISSQRDCFDVLYGFKLKDLLLLCSPAGGFKGAEEEIQEIQTLNLNVKLIIQTNCINKLFLEENKVPWTLFEARKVAGSATYKQSKQYEIVLSFKVSCFLPLLINQQLGGWSVSSFHWDFKDSLPEL